jgi:hypothetical protein
MYRLLSLKTRKNVKTTARRSPVSRELRRFESQNLGIFAARSITRTKWIGRLELRTVRLGFTKRAASCWNDVCCLPVYFWVVLLLLDADETARDDRLLKILIPADV